MRKKHFILLCALLGVLIFTKAKALGISSILSFLIAYLLDPLVQKMERRKMNRKVVVVLIYVFLTLLLVTGGVKFGTYIYAQAQDFVKDLPLYIEKGKDVTARLGEKYVWLFNAVKDLDVYVATSLKKFLAGAVATASQSVYIFIVFIFSFSLLMNRDSAIEAVRKFFGEEKIEEHMVLLKKIDGVLKGFFKGRLLVSFAVTLITLIGTTLIGIPHAGFIALFTGVASFIPYYGALAGIIPGLLVSVGTAAYVKTSVSVVILIIVVSSIESNLLTPILTGRHVKLHPGIIIFSIICGGALYGFWGIVFAMPVAGIIKVVYEESRP